MSSFPVLTASERVSTSADSAGFRRSSLHRGPPPLEWGRAERAEQGAARPAVTAFPVPASSSPGAQFRTRDGKRGSCSPTATIVSPTSAIVRRPGCVFAACGPFCSCGLGVCVDTTHTGPLTGGDNRERGRRARRSPNARLQSCLGSAVRSAKCLRASVAVR